MTGSKFDELLDPLVAAVMGAVFPLRGDGREGAEERIRPALAEALRSTVTAQGGQEIDGDRLTIDSCRETAREYLDRFLPNNPGQRDAILDWTAGLIRGVREADQREQWIRQGYSFDARTAWERADEAERRAAGLEHVVRLVKRATRDVKVGRG